MTDRYLTGVACNLTWQQAAALEKQGAVLKQLPTGKFDAYRFSDTPIYEGQHAWKGF